LVIGFHDTVENVRDVFLGHSVELTNIVAVLCAV